MANNFSGDANCKALWKFESGALTTDSKGSNTLSNTGVAGDTTNQKEGNGCGDWELTESDYMSIADASLDAGFPLKSGDTNKNISICAWIKLESITDVNIILCKWGNPVPPTRSIALSITIAGKAQLVLGYNSGASGEFEIHATVLSTGTWYHITGTYQNSDKAYAVMVRDANGNVVGTDLTGTATLDANKLYVAAEPVAIGCEKTSTTPVTFFDGLIDEVIVFSDIITATEATAIAKGIYGVKPWYYYAQQ